MLPPPDLLLPLPLLPRARKLAFFVRSKSLRQPLFPLSPLLRRQPRAWHAIPLEAKFETIPLGSLDALTLALGLIVARRVVGKPLLLLLLHLLLVAEEELVGLVVPDAGFLMRSRVLGRRL